MTILEGPAGSGKTHLAGFLKHQAVVNEVPQLVKWERPRAYEGLLGVEHSQLKDYGRILDALYARVNEVQSLETDRVIRPFLLDRYLLSQLVYGTIRSGREEISSTRAYNLFTAGILSVIHAWREIFYRMGISPITPHFHLTWMVLLPAASRLEDNRSYADRAFPYSAETEISMYTKATLVMQELFPQLEKDFLSTDMVPLTLEVFPFHLDSPASYDSMYLRVRDHMIQIKDFYQERS